MEPALNANSTPRLSIRPYFDGPEPFGFQAILQSWTESWSRHYSQDATLTFLSPINLKQAQNRADLPSGLKILERIRNPDLFFSEESRGIELGGIEITDHSPDGSNIEKRYPFLWASRRGKISAFAVSRYLKQRPNRQINRFPFRHAFRNVQFLKEWTPKARDEHGQLCQFLPLRELHLEDIELVPPTIRDQLGSWPLLGEFFAHSLAVKVFEGARVDDAARWLEGFKGRLEALANACMANATRESEANTLLKLEDRWVQVYNTRPDSGHWERGEGQFDSIDGRIMFTLDEISLLDPRDRPAKFEFWLPQLASGHPWIAEQRSRGFGSKRLRNLLVELASECTTRFADELTAEDWQLLQANPSMLLERLDWEPSVYRVADLVPPERRAAVAKKGISNWPREIPRIEALLSDGTLYFSSHRAYIPGWRDDLALSLAKVPHGCTVLIPRIPHALLADLLNGVQCTVIPAEQCTKPQLLMLRQLHRQKTRED